MKKTRVMVIGLGMIFLAVSSGYAQEQGRNHQDWQEKKEEVFKELNLTPEQKKKLEDNRKAQHQEAQKFREALRANHKELQAKLKDSAVTRGDVEPLVSEIKSLQAKLTDNRINGIFTVKTILTPEQFVKFNQLIEKQMKNRKGKNSRGDMRKKSQGPPPGME